MDDLWPYGARQLFYSVSASFREWCKVTAHMQSRPTAFLQFTNGGTDDGVHLMSVNKQQAQRKTY